MAKKRRTIEYEASSGNVFADLGLPNPDQELLKANLTLQIFRAIKVRQLTQAKAGKILGIPQPHVSDLMRGRARAFSAERLMQFLTALTGRRCLDRSPRRGNVAIRAQPVSRARASVSS